MKAAVISGFNSIIIDNLPIPEIDDYEVLVKVKSVGICKSDIEILEGRHPFTKELFAQHKKINLTPGHEWSGVVYEVGSK